MGSPFSVGATCSVEHRHASDVRRSTPGGPRSGPGYAVLDHHHLIDPIRPTRGRIAISSHSAYTRCLRCAGAPRRPASGSGLSLFIPSWHAILYRPRGLQHRQFQTAMLTWPSLRDHRLGIPNIPAIRFTRGTHFGASWFTHLLRPVRLLAPLHGSDWDAPALGDFYFQAFDSSVSLPVAGYDYNSDWTPCMGLFLSRSFRKHNHLSSVVSLFDLKARFFVPTRHSGKPSRAGAVKAGRLFGDHPQGCLDSSEHGGTIECSRGQVSKMTIRGELAFERGSIAPQPCMRWVQGPEP